MGLVVVAASGGAPSKGRIVATRMRFAKFGRRGVLSEAWSPPAGAAWDVQRRAGMCRRDLWAEVSSSTSSGSPAEDEDDENDEDMSCKHSVVMTGAQPLTLLTLLNVLAPTAMQVEQLVQVLGKCLSPYMKSKRIVRFSKWKIKCHLQCNWFAVFRCHDTGVTGRG